MDGVTSDNLRPVSKNRMLTAAEFELGIGDILQEVASDFQLQAARYAMHKVRLFHYQMMMKTETMSPDIAKQYYLAAMQNYDDMMKSSANGCFSEAIDKEMAEFDINEAFSAAR